MPGRHYVTTAMSLLMLEVYYRHLPLFANSTAGAGAEQPPPDALRDGRGAVSCRMIDWRKPTQPVRGQQGGSP